jgi:hypothetical protein
LNIFEIIWWVSVGLAGLTIATLIFLYFRRLIIDARVARQTLKRAALQDYVYAVLGGTAEGTRTFTPGEQRILIGLVTEMMRGITGAMRDQLVDILDKHVDQDRMARGLKTGAPEDRAKIAARLFWAKSPAAIEALREALNDPNPQVVMAAINSLISSGQKLSLIDIVPKLEARGMLGHRGVRDIFRKLAPHNASALLALIEDKDPAVAVLAIDALARMPSPAALRRLAHIVVAHPSVDVRATAVRTIGLMNNRAFDGAILTALADPGWEVKGQAAIAAGRMRLLEALPMLERLARDSNWWLQLRSAQALTRLGEQGIAILERLRADPDHARLAEFALSERHL